MPRYFFDIQDHNFIMDDEGTELPNTDVAKVQGIVSAAEYMRDHPELVWGGQEIRVHIFDEVRAPVFLVAVLGVDLRRGF